MLIGAVIQARIGSSRLPGKTLMKIGNKTIIEHIIDRVKQCKRVNKVIVAIPNSEKDKNLYNFLKDKKIEVFTGSENDVLSRYYKCAEYYNLDHIIRLTGDAPFIDSEIIDLIVTEHINDNYDYTSNGWQESRTFPLGLDVRIMNRKTLNKINELAKSEYDREHVTTYIHSNLEKFNYKIIKAEGIWKNRDIELVVNNKEDFDNLTKLYNELYDNSANIDVKKIINYLAGKE